MSPTDCHGGSSRNASCDPDIREPSERLTIAAERLVAPGQDAGSRRCPSTLRWPVSAMRWGSRNPRASSPRMCSWSWSASLIASCVNSSSSSRRARPPADRLDRLAHVGRERVPRVGLDLERAKQPSGESLEVVEGRQLALHRGSDLAHEYLGGGVLAGEESACAQGAPTQRVGEGVRVHHAQVAPVEHFELLEIEDGGTLGDPRDAELLDSSSTVNMVVLSSKLHPNSARAFNDRRLNEPGVAEFLDRGGAVALGQALFVRAQDQRDVGVLRRLGRRARG